MKKKSNDRFGACETIVDAMAQEYPFDSGKSIFNDFEKLEIENDLTKIESFNGCLMMQFCINAVY